MPTRDERLALNEGMFRDANERMVQWGERHDSEQPERYFCECSDPDCRQHILLRVEQYEEVRSNSRWFAVATGHANLEVERVISPDDGFDVVEKHDTVTELVEELDQRRPDA